MSKKNTDVSIFTTPDDRMVVTIRLILAFSALVIIFIDQSEPNRYVIETYLVLILYTLYSAVLFLFIHKSAFINRILPYSHWLDIFWYIILIALSSGTSSLFFFFFFFAILNASFSSGFLSGLKITFVSSMSFIIVGLFASPDGQAFELNRFLLRPMYLISLGYMMAHWGGFEIKTKRRLALLKEIAVVSNPRFGVDRTISVVIELLRHFYGADESLLVINNPENNEYVLYRSNRITRKADVKSYSLNSNVLENIFSLPENCAAVYGEKKYWLSLSNKNFYAVDLTENRKIEQKEEEIFENVAEKLDTKSYLTIPIYHRGETIGRIFLLNHKVGIFEQTDIDFLL